MFGKIIIGSIIFFFPLITYGARTITTSTIDANTIQIHVVADTWADMISPQIDCGTAPPDGSWGFIFHKTGTDYQSTNQIYTKGQLDITENITLSANGSYGNGVIYGSNATNWSNLYNVTSCNTSGVKPFGGPAIDYGTTTIPLPFSTSSGNPCIIASGTLCLFSMTTSTDLMFRNFLEFSYTFLYGILFFSVAWIIFKIVKK